LGANIGIFVGQLLDDEVGPWTRFRQAEKLLRLAQRFTPARVDSACARALAYEITDVRRLERILREALDTAEPTAQTQADGSGEARAELAEAMPSARFARPGSAFARPGPVGSEATVRADAAPSSGERLDAGDACGTAVGLQAVDPAADSTREVSALTTNAAGHHCLPTEVRG